MPLGTDGIPRQWSRLCRAGKACMRWTGLQPATLRDWVCGGTRVCEHRVCVSWTGWLGVLVLIVGGLLGAPGELYVIDICG